MIEQVLIDNGLSLKEAKVYLAVLEMGEGTIAQIAAKSRIKRTTVYSLVDSLKTHGIVSPNKRRGIHYVSPLSPSILIQRFKNASDRAEASLPELLDMAYNSPLKPRIQFFEGMEGVKEILGQFSQSLAPGMGFTDYANMPDTLLQFIRKEIVPERRKHKNRARYLLPDNSTNRTVQKDDERYYTEHCVTSFPLAENPIELLLFGESKVAFISFTKEELFGLVIDSKAIYKTLHNIFSLIWNFSRRN